MVTSHHRQRGAAGIEIAGITLLVAAFFAAALTTVALGAPSVLGREVSASICKAWNTLPGIDMGACATAEGDGDEASGSPDGTPVEEEPPYTEREWTYDEVTDGPMVFIGDSYGSGEGAGDYDPDTDYGPSWWNPFDNDDAENRCHRSDNAWGIGIGDQHWPDNYTFNACSGARTRHVQNPNNGNHGEGPQGDAIDRDTTMIFVSMGGNDVGFADVLQDCVVRHNFAPWSTCEGKWTDVDPDDPQGRTRLEVNLDQLESDLREMYRYLREQSEDGAHIVHMGYPHLFDPDYYGMSVANSDAQWMNDVADQLNAMMARVAREEGVHFIDPTEAFAGHGVGSDEPWILNLGVGNHRALPPESFHPNADGQAAMQQLIEDYLNSLP